MTTSSPKSQSPAASVNKTPAKVLILGSGIAGLTSAIHFSEFSNVILLAKSSLDEGNTRYAQGGIASVWSKSDSIQEHKADTLEAGAGLCNEQIVDICVSEGPTAVQSLIDWGVQFTKTEASDYDLHQEGGHHKRRILHAQDFTGRAIEEALIAKVRSIPNISILENHMAIDFIMEGKFNDGKIDPKRATPGSRLGACLGAYVLNCETNGIFPLAADMTVIASGGAGKVYLYTTNPDVATGDGIAMAYRAGARIANLEFMQFHPTCLYHSNAKTFLITEALRGEGAILRNIAGEDFMKRYHEMGSLAPRYVVSQAIDMELKKTGAAHVWLDVSAINEHEFREKFPQVYATCEKFGIKPPHDKIPVVPAAHYLCGGIVVDEHAQTSVRGLLAVGESACTGLHGANRLASNSLLEAAVFARRAASHARDHLVKNTIPNAAKTLPEWDFGRAVDMEEQIDIAATWREIRSLMWNYVGIVRSNRRLKRARERLSLIRHEVNEDYWKFKVNRDLIELRNLLSVSELIVECALRRKESRGLHVNVDFPRAVDNEAKDTIL
ncbi:MAG: L-aspartate oxidase [Bdellovibrionales bacterium]|nr:L-aspartate oxidase [Bdellovibrionales bacterium]